MEKGSGGDSVGARELSPQPATGRGCQCFRVFHLSPKNWHFTRNPKLQENKLWLTRTIKPHNAEDKQKETELHLLFCPST